MAEINSPKPTGLGGFLKGILTEVLVTATSQPGGGGAPQSQGRQAAKPSYFLCGGSWGPNPRAQLETSFRAARSSDVRSDAYGFRLVLDLKRTRSSEAAGGSFSGGSSYQGGTVQGGATYPGGTVRTYPGGTVQGGTVQGGTVKGGTVRGGTYAPGSSASPGFRREAAPSQGGSSTNRPTTK